MEDIRKFSTFKQAIEFAEDNIGKYGYEVCEVRGKQSMLCSTGLPIEARLREPIETVVEDFLSEVFGIDDDSIAIDIGAEVCGTIIKKIEAYANVNIISAYLDY